MAKDLQPAPPLKKLKLTVNKILSRRGGDEALVSFYGYPRSVNVSLSLYLMCDVMSDVYNFVAEFSMFGCLKR